MDKIVFITGASSGIGAGCARKFASQGASLILNARNVNKLSALKEELEKQYGTEIYLSLIHISAKERYEEFKQQFPQIYLNFTRWHI